MDIYIPYEKSYPNLEKALKEGAKIHVFKSGGGLRVVRLEKDEELISYGEHPYFSTALSHAESDFELSYEEQYEGENAKHQFYAFGVHPLPNDAIDMYVYHHGIAFDIFYSKKWNSFVCVSDVYESQEIKQHLKDPENFDCIYGSTDNIVGAITNCLLSMRLAKRENLMKEY